RRGRGTGVQCACAGQRTRGDLDRGHRARLPERVGADPHTAGKADACGGRPRTDADRRRLVGALAHRTELVGRHTAPTASVPPGGTYVPLVPSEVYQTGWWDPVANQFGTPDG